VLHELAKGLANKQIADVLNISQHTTKGYLKTIMTKLQCGRPDGSRDRGDSTRLDPPVTAVKKIQTAKLPGSQPRSTQ